ncbi:hypothetical protein LCGC14_0422740 [marine sediment metagenome]|uniref:Uncharacterized protein n=1 Tax=marine sediment metagenome TaxID=412755 RepID=A0A0F9VCD4_9ZZZZ
MLTKKDFKAVAEIIKTVIGGKSDCTNFEIGWHGATEDIAEHLADYFITQDPRFDREQFMKACGLGG